MSSDVEFSTSELWVAKSATRDFRDSEWIPVDMERTNKLECTYSIETGDGFVAAFGDWTFDFVPAIPTHLTTNIQIVAPKPK
jgi:hypothetical protein